MGALQGGLTYRQYKVRDRLPTHWQAKVQQGLVNNVAKPLDPEGEFDRVVGWCSVHFILDTDMSLEQSLRDPYLMVAMRVESIKIPSGLLRMHCEAEERKVKRELKKEALSRYERAEVREQVEAKLRKRVLPSMKSYELLWNTETGVVRFFTTNKGLNEELMDLFEDSFGLTLVPEYAYTIAQDSELALDKTQLEALDSVEPTPFIDDETLFESMQG